MELDISLFNKILVFVEDHGQVGLSELEYFGNKRQALGALGRLEGLNYIQRIKSDDSEYFVLTEKGDACLSDILSRLPDPNHTWDKKWRIILFDVPESKRTIRQMFRLKLMDLGARMLQSSVWITPNRDVVDRFNSIITETDLVESVHFFESDHVGGNQIDVVKLWDLPKVAEDYQNLFQQFQKEYRQLKNRQNRSFFAKCMVVNLALHCKNDPRLPAELMPKNWVGYEAITWYEKLRVYCNGAD
jgi:phenylacetic acid degradation operon negative regulatory protein